MAYLHAEIVREVLSADKKAKVAFLKRHDGFYEFRGYVERVEGKPYWSPTRYSGLYATIEETEQSAIMEIPWLGEELRIPKGTI